MMKTLFITLLLLLVTPAFSTDPLLERSSLDNFEKLISKEELTAKVEEYAQILNTDFKQDGIDEIVLVAVMKGAICITSDLMRALDIHSVLECVRAQSYGARGTSRGKLTVSGLDNIEIEGKDILVIDDIFDSGVTLHTMVEKIKERHPKSIRSLVAVKKDRPHAVDYLPDYTMFTVEDRFILGYGMDYKELWRDLSDIYAID